MLVLKYHTEAQRVQRLALAREGGIFGSSRRGAEDAEGDFGDGAHEGTLEASKRRGCV